jgi:hypothetical protein
LAWLGPTWPYGTLPNHPVETNPHHNVTRLTAEQRRNRNSSRAALQPNRTTVNLEGISDQITKATDHNTSKQPGATRTSSADTAERPDTALSTAVPVYEKKNKNAIAIRIATIEETYGILRNDTTPSSNHGVSNDVRIYPSIATSVTNQAT